MDKVYKAAFVDVIRRELDGCGPDAEAAFYARLSADDQREFRTLLPMAWIDPELAARIVEAAASVVLQGHPTPVEELGRRQARHDLTFIYRVLLKVATVQSVISRTAQLFGTYHRKGRALVERSKDAKEGVLMVVDYPEMPRTIRRHVAGYVRGILELTGARDVQVRLDDSDPRALRFQVCWR